MTIEQKSYKILKAFHDIVHKGKSGVSIKIYADWDINTLTIETPDDDHAHFGHEENGFDELINDIYNHFRK